MVSYEQSDLTDSQWELIKDHFSVGHYGNRRKHPVREMVNAILYVIKSGCQWRMLPKDFPPFSAVFATTDVNSEKFGKRSKMIW
jgi:putative transposase